MHSNHEVSTIEILPILMVEISPVIISGGPISASFMKHGALISDASNYPYPFHGTSSKIFNREVAPQRIQWHMVSQ